MNNRLVRSAVFGVYSIALVVIGIFIVPAIHKYETEHYQVASVSTHHLAEWNRVPVGITLSGLQNYNIGPATVQHMDRQIGSAKYFWHVNTIRLQIVQDRLVGSKGNIDNTWYMYYVNRVVTYALHLHLLVVLNAQTEKSTGFDKEENYPTHATTVFWRDMMQEYGNHKNIIFDLFNEPRRITWGTWYDKTQALVNFIRDNGINNQIWVEGLNWATTLQGMPLIQGKNIVYTYHHPASTASGAAPYNPGIWNQNFGYLAQEGYKVVDGEFTNYVGNFDWTKNPIKSVQAYFNYLERNHIGMIAWSLVPGSLNQNFKNNSMTKEPQGDGVLVHNWFTHLWKEHYRLAA